MVKDVVVKLLNLQEHKMLNVHCVYHQIALLRSDLDSELAFISDYASIMIQL